MIYLINRIFDIYISIANYFIKISKVHINIIFFNIYRIIYFLNYNNSCFYSENFSGNTFGIHRFFDFCDFSTGLWNLRVQSHQWDGQAFWRKKWLKKWHAVNEGKDENAFPGLTECMAQINEIIREVASGERAPSLTADVVMKYIA